MLALQFRFSSSIILSEQTTYPPLKKLYILLLYFLCNSFEESRSSGHERIVIENRRQGEWILWGRGKKGKGEKELELIEYM